MKINLIFFLVLAFLVSKETHAQEVFRYNVEKKIKALKQITPANCFSHGEIDCSKGADIDGSVICKDGFRDAVMSYDSLCLEVRLEVQYLVNTNSPQTPYIKHSRKLIEDLKGYKPLTLHLNIRNLSDVKAKNIKVEFTLERRYPYNAQGPETIEPYGLAEYSLELSTLAKVPTLEQLLKTVYKVDCDNCSGILTSK